METLDELKHRYYKLKQLSISEIDLNEINDLLQAIRDSGKKIHDSELERLYVSDTIRFEGNSDKIKVITASEIFAEAIRRTSNNESISSLFEIDKG